MLGKLLKHELHATGRIMLPSLAALVLLAGMANLSYQGIRYVESDFINIMLAFVIGLFFLGLFAAGVLSVIIMVYRFYKNILGNEGYLMLTLPVNAHGLIWSKLLVSLLWVFITFLVCTGLFMMTVFHFAELGFKDFLNWLPDLRESLYWFYERTPVTPLHMTLYIAEALLLAVIAGIVQCLHFYSAMAVGHSFTKNKVLLSIVFYIVIGFGLQMLTTVFWILPATTGFLAIDTVDQLIGGLHRAFLYFCVVELILGFILYLLTYLPLEKGLNLN